MGGEDRDLRFGMRRVLRDELLAQDDEEADRGLLQYGSGSVRQAQSA